MINIDNRIRNLIAKLFANKISEEELEELNKWDDSFDLDEEIEITDSETDDLNEIGERLIVRINKNRKKKATIYNMVKQYKNVAAIILSVSILFTSFAIYLNSQDQESNIAWNDIHVKNGQKKILTFSDSSKIVLNSGTHFKYPSFIDENNTEVYLDGEAYFEITPNKKRKFIVHTSKLSTSVLGTKFNISAFNDDSEISVSLVSGKVKVSRNKTGDTNKSVILRPSEQYVLFKDSNKEVVQSFDINENIGWKDNQLVFNKKPLRQILKVLSRTCGVTFELSKNKHLDRNFTASFENTSLSTVIRSIKKLTNLNYSIKEDENVKKIIFY